LCRAVSVFALVERLGGSARWQYITASHFQEVLALPHGEQERFLTLADSQRWAVSHLREAIKARPSRSSTSARRRAVRAVQRFGSLLSKHLQTLLEADSANVDSTALAELLQRLETVLQDLERNAKSASRVASAKSDIVELAPSLRNPAQGS
jgi:hypothetical protein